MKASRTVAVIGLLIALVALAIVVAGPAPVAAQEDCETNCYDGHWDPWFVACLSYPTGSCSRCDVVCPGGGGDGIDEEHQG